MAGTAEAGMESALVGDVAIPETIEVKPSGVRTQDPREAGPVHVGHHMWQRLQMDAILNAALLAASVRQLTEVMVLNRLVHPCSELAMVDGAKRVAVADVLGVGTDKLNEDRLYRNLDKLHGPRVGIETELHARERSLFNLQAQLLFYDLTNTYFDFGAGVSTYMALQDPSSMLGIHLTTPELWPPVSPDTPLSEAEAAYVAAVRIWDSAERGYSALQFTRPQTLGYALNDSPAGLAAWILEKWRDWSDSGGGLEGTLPRDFLLTLLTLYWATGSITCTFVVGQMSRTRH